MNALSEREHSFCVAYASPTSETRNNGTRSAVAAGYSERSASVQASRLLKRDKIQREIADLQSVLVAARVAQEQLTLEVIRAEHLRLSRRYEREGEAASATRNLELLGRTIGAYRENVAVGLGTVRELDEAMADEAVRIAALRVKASIPPILPREHTTGEAVGQGDTAQAMEAGEQAIGQAAAADETPPAGGHEEADAGTKNPDADPHDPPSPPGSSIGEAPPAPK